MPYRPNEFVPNFTVFNGGTAGTTVSPGQYALDWVVSLGGSVEVVGPGNNELRVVMPFTEDNTPAQIPDQLNAMLTDYRASVIAAVAGKVYPPGSDQPFNPPQSYWP